MAVLANSDLTAGAKVTLIALGSHLNFETGQLNPSAKLLGRETGHTERAVLKHLQAGRRALLTAWDGTHGRTSNRYQLFLPTMNGGTRLEHANPEQRDTVGTPATTNNRSGLGQATLNGKVTNPEREGRQPCPAVHTNLVNHENLCPALEKLRATIGAERWRKHLFAGADFRSPNTIVFRSKKHLEFALGHYRDDFERLGYLTEARNAV